MASDRQESAAHRSGCPINLTLEVLGDKWSLIIVRDMMFGNRRHYRELLAKNEEGVASNILADRLRRLMAEGVISREDDPSHKQKAIYSLTEKGIELLPVFAMIGAWGRKWLPVTEELSIRAQLMEEGGPAMWEEFMEELREEHLSVPPARPKDGPGVRERLYAAYREVVERKAEAAAS